MELLNGTVAAIADSSPSSSPSIHQTGLFIACCPFHNWGSSAWQFKSHQPEHHSTNGRGCVASWRLSLCTLVMIALWAHKNCTSGISFCNFPRSWAKCAWRICMSYQSLLRFISIDNKIWSQHERFYRYYIMALLLHELKIYYENSRFPDSSSSSSFYFSYFIYFLIRLSTGEGEDATRIYYIPTHTDDDDGDHQLL